MLEETNHVNLTKNLMNAPTLVGFICFGKMESIRAYETPITSINNSYLGDVNSCRFCQYNLT